jgi:hypothetical protein
MSTAIKTLDFQDSNDSTKAQVGLPSDLRRHSTVYVPRLSLTFRLRFTGDGEGIVGEIELRPHEGLVIAVV